MASLRPGPTIRLGGIDADRVARLAEVGGAWPPVLVRRADHTIVDGRYRCLAAEALGRSTIECVYFDGSAEAAFIEAISRNTCHGEPLSLRERREAARTLLSSNPAWSDRSVADLCALAPGTVQRVRLELEATAAMPSHGRADARIGRDGRQRPVEPSRSRQSIAALALSHPDASLREIARLAGCSPETVRTVRKQLRDDPSLAELVEIRAASRTEPASWSEDRAFANSPELAAFVGWFESTAIEDDWQERLVALPLSRVYAVVDEARRRAARWSAFAAELETDIHQRTRRSAHAG